MLSNPTILYGIHSFTPYRLADRLFYGLMKVIGGADLALTSDLNQLYAGSNKYSWAAESGTVSTELTVKVKAYPGFLYELFLGATVTEASADATGTVASFDNVKGLSVKDAVNGISAAAASTTNVANMKFGKFVLKAVSTTTFDVYASSDIDATSGAKMSYEDDTLKINAAPITAAAGTVEIPVIGVKLTVTGTPAFVVGDTAKFEVRPPNNGSTKVVVGAAGATMPSFGSIFYAQKRATKEMYEIEAYNCVGSGLPISLAENAFSEPELKMSLLYEASQDAVFEIRHIKPK